MALLEYVTRLRSAAPPALTVMAQAVPPNDNGMLVWDQYFPRVNVDSIRLDDVTTVDYRPTADRREWNAPGRRVPLIIPNLRSMEILPIEAESVIDEREMQLLMERGNGNLDIIMEIMEARLPARADMLAGSDYRRLEVDALQAWSAGTVTVRNPQDAAKTVTTSLGFDSGRYQTALTAWNDGSLNAYNEFLSWLEGARDAIGGVEGAVMRQATFNAIQADAPNAIPGISQTVRATRAQIEQLLQDELDGAFRIVIMERSVDVFTDGGTAYTRTKTWPAHTVAAIPSGGRVGSSYFAPVVRGQEMSSLNPEAAIDVRGVTVYHLLENDGKELKLQGQLNALTIPSEQNVWVIDAGV